MIDIDWTQVLIGGAAICSFIMVGAVLFIGACARIGKYVADHNDRKAERIMSGMSEDELLLAIRNYDGH